MIVSHSTKVAVLAFVEPAFQGLGVPSTRTTLRGESRDHTQLCVCSGHRNRRQQLG